MHMPPVSVKCCSSATRGSSRRPALVLHTCPHLPAELSVLLELTRTAARCVHIPKVASIRRFRHEHTSVVCGGPRFLLTLRKAVIAAATHKEHIKIFWEAGYTVFPRAVPSDIVAKVRRIASRLKYPSIFKQEVGEAPYHSIMQAPLPKPLKPLLKDLGVAISHDIIKKVTYMRWKPAQWAILKRLLGGDEQETHHDFPSFETGRAQAKCDSI
ncbi:hypothetical protein PybrP1_007025 [[Pythium] brassicae (nom. inval.)]|nr:hypothetical protein PybrP1_007025 [[Pythium] brassicae (nom. inval.)]